MKEIVLWIVLIAVLAGTVDRALLGMEERGWINYRRNGPSRGAMAYHMLELQSIYDPGTQQVIEVRYEARRRNDESGDPPAVDPDEQA